MSLLDRLQRFAEVGTVIACPSMTLLAGDHELPVVVGSGEIVVNSTTSFRYRVQGMPEDLGHALRTLNRIHQAPYDGRLRERLEAVAEDGTRLHCGWTIPEVDPGERGEDWIFTGEFDAVTVNDDGPTSVFTNVAYLLPVHHTARIVLRRFFPKPGLDGQCVHRISVLGTDVTFTLDDEANTLLIHAPGTTQLPVTFAENWLGEPLRILFGQPIYPRLIARGTGTYVMNWIRPSPPWSTRADACALWQGEKALIDKDGFWTSYARLLAYIASARCFEANPITELYGEVIQASDGSRWVWALTYASAVEGLVNLIFPRGSRRSDMAAREIEHLESEIKKFKAHVDLWAGDPRLKGPAKAAAARMLETSAAIGLRQLRDDGWITADQYEAWSALRNNVMHGKLVSPYSSAKDDKLLLDLSGLLHALTRRIIASVEPATGKTSVPLPPVNSSDSQAKMPDGGAQS